MTIHDDIEYFEVRASDDIVKADRELACTYCDAVLCDVEPGDTLRVLASVAEDHLTHCPAAEQED